MAPCLPERLHGVPPCLPERLTAFLPVCPNAFTAFLRFVSGYGSLPARLKCNNCSHLRRSIGFAFVEIAFPLVARAVVIPTRLERVCA